MHHKTLPLELSGLEATICFSTTVVQPGNKNRHESRNSNLQDPYWKYNLKHCVKSKADANLLQAFFITVRGKEIAFLVKDPLDYTVSQYIHGVPEQTPDGVRTEFQIFKTYTDVLDNFIRRDITKPIGETFTVTVIIDGDPAVWPPSEVDEETGIITFSTAPPEGAWLLVECEFNVPIRFDTDELAANLEQYWKIDTVETAHVYFPDIPAIEVWGE